MSSVMCDVTAMAQPGSEGGAMILYYHQNYTKQQINAVLNQIKTCVRTCQYTISLNANRQENIAFINEYNLRSDKQRKILLQIQTEDFCHALFNTKNGYEHEVLYVFAPQIQLYNIENNLETVNVYVKFNLIKAQQHLRTIVISFHKRNRPIEYLFR